MVEILNFAFSFLLEIIRVLRQTFFVYWIYIGVIGIVISVVLFIRGHNHD